MANQTGSSSSIFSRLRGLGRKPKREIIEEVQDPSDLSWSNFLRILEDEDDAQAIADGNALALELLFRYGQLKGDSEREWLIDQLLRKIAGEHYEDFIRLYSFDEEFGASYSWSRGKPPRSI